MKITKPDYIRNFNTYEYIKAIYNYLSEYPIEKHETDTIVLETLTYNEGQEIFEPLEYSKNDEYIVTVTPENVSAGVYVSPSIMTAILNDTAEHYATVNIFTKNIDGVLDMATEPIVSIQKIDTGIKFVMLSEFVDSVIIRIEKRINKE